MGQNIMNNEGSFNQNQPRTAISGVVARQYPYFGPIDNPEKYQSAYANKLALLERRRQSGYESSVPQVQLIGNGTVYNHEGLAEANLKHASHKTFHKTVVSAEDEAKVTRFYRRHIDAALYDLSPPRVTTLYGIEVPQAAKQTCRYDDGTGDELSVPLGTT
ncbi:hypothetical protein C8R47DRAFT_1221198 [Mycena vitilis]|nr:hypothetical protein C8R47DRAFT_1221198 [Mycena vitilis]